jgi:mRNA-degrading endonuclease RelE of RelBE toxin-antitoxin system
VTIQTTRRFDKDYAALPEEARDAVDSKLALFLSNSRHPSLRIKKMEGTKDIWEMRITINYRITFQVIEDTAVLRRVGTHDVLKRP